MEGLISEILKNVDGKGDLTVVEQVALLYLLKQKLDSGLHGSYPYADIAAIMYASHPEEVQKWNRVRLRKWFDYRFAPEKGLTSILEDQLGFYVRLVKLELGELIQKVRDSYNEWHSTTHRLIDFIDPPTKPTKKRKRCELLKLEEPYDSIAASVKDVYGKGKLKAVEKIGTLWLLLHHLKSNTDLSCLYSDIARYLNYYRPAEYHRNNHSICKSIGVRISPKGGITTVSKKDMPIYVSKVEDWFNKVANKAGPGTPAQRLVQAISAAERKRIKDEEDAELLTYFTDIFGKDA